MGISSDTVGNLNWRLTREGNERNASRPQKRIYVNLRDDKRKIYYDNPGKGMVYGS